VDQQNAAMKKPRSALPLLVSKVETWTTLGPPLLTFGFASAVFWVTFPALVGNPLPEVVRTAQPASERLNVTVYDPEPGVCAAMPVTPLWNAMLPSEFTYAKSLVAGSPG
jgi:hypothetical protein